jgi:hypothetical protein
MGSICPKTLRRIIHAPEFAHDHEFLRTQSEKLGAISNALTHPKLIDIAQQLTIWPGDAPEVITQRNENNIGDVGSENQLGGLGTRGFETRHIPLGDVCVGGVCAGRVSVGDPCVSNIYVGEVECVHCEAFSK